MHALGCFSPATSLWYLFPLCVVPDWCMTFCSGGAVPKAPPPGHHGARREGANSGLRANEDSTVSAKFQNHQGRITNDCCRTIAANLSEARVDVVQTCTVQQSMNGFRE